MLCFRKWLRNNSFIVDFFSKVIMGGAAIFVSILAYRISDLQYTLAEVVAAPDFHVSRQLARDDNGYLAHAKLEISNVGGPAQNIDVSHMDFITVKREGKAQQVPIVGYYFSQHSTGNPLGVVSTLFGFNSNKQFHAIYNESLSAESQKKFGFVDVAVFTLVQIRYVTRLGKIETANFIDGWKANSENVVELNLIRDRSEKLLCQRDIGNLSLALLVEAAENIAKNKSCRERVN